MTSGAAVALPRIAVLATGGTIATVQQGESVALRTGEEVLAAVPELDRLAEIEPIEVLQLPSHLMSLGDVDAVGRATIRHATRPELDGVVVLHGTDILEESAFLADLWHHGDTPIVFTGAQRPAGDPAGDGPGNIRDAVVVAGSPSARGIGVLVCIGATVHEAARAEKWDTASLDPFGAAHRELGQVSGTTFRLLRRPDIRMPMQPGALRHRVDVLRLAAGYDGTLIREAQEAGAQGIVLEAFGGGTAPEDVVEAVGDATAASLIVLLSTRCPRGGVWPQPGLGSSSHLVAAGALPVGDLDGVKARIVLLSALAAADGDPGRARTLVQRWLTGTGRGRVWAPSLKPGAPGGSRVQGTGDRPSLAE